MIRSRQDFMNQGLLVPTAKDWRVRLVFVDGTERVVRVTPSSLTEEVAVERAKRHAKIFDETILKKVEATRAEPSAKVNGHGIIQK